MNSINFKYVFEENYNPKYVNGAFGGLGPQGEIILHFYCERAAIPNQINYEATAGNEFGQCQLGDIKSVEPENLDETYIRYIQSGIILDRQHAQDIYKWLERILGEEDRQDGQNK